MHTNKPFKIFLSYSRANNNIANEIDRDFSRVGVHLTRDIREINYRGSIRDFMQRIQEMDFVLMIISDEFLRSEFCMYEVMELLHTQAFEKRILPVLLDNASQIFKPAARKKYYDHWTETITSAALLEQQYTNTDYTETLNRYKSIINSLPDFFQKIADLNILSFDVLKQQHYKPMLDILGIEDGDILEQALKITDIEDSEDRDLAFEEFFNRYPKNRYGLFIKANFETTAKQLKKARKHYEEIVTKYPLFTNAYNSLANLLAENTQEYAMARKHYEKAIEIDAGYAEAHYNFALLLEDAFKDYAAAREHYEIAVEYNPGYVDAHYNLAILYKQKYNDYDAAMQHYNTVIENDPDHYLARYNLAILLNSIGNPESARYQYQRVLNLKPGYAPAHFNFALLLANGYEDYTASRVQYEAAIASNPEHYNAHYNLANLLASHLNDYDGARKHYEAALQLNPQFAAAHSALGMLLTNHFSDYEAAKQHYENAIKLDPDYARAHFKLAVLLHLHFDAAALARKYYLQAIQINPSFADMALEEYLGIQQ